MSAAPATNEVVPASDVPSAASRPHVVMVVPRGEAVRNFVYSDTLCRLSEGARVTLLSVVDDEPLRERVRPFTEEVISLRQYPVHPIPRYTRALAETAHDRWLWSAVVRNRWETYDRTATTAPKRVKRVVTKALARALTNPAAIHALSTMEQHTNWALRPTREFDELFRRLQPDLVFNGSHIHGLAGELPLRVAKGMGIPTAGFIFSWDNLTSRSRIFVPYDYYLVWHQPMHDQLLEIYPRVTPDRVFVTGTPQFDYHFKPEFCLSREKLCREIGIDPKRPFILYTTGIDHHFFEEYRHVQLVIQLLGELGLHPKPQLVVRNYVKGTSPELQAMAQQSCTDVVFPKVLWDAKWQTPLYEDLAIYSSLVHHAALSINAASTVSLEFLMLDKPVINLDFDPPGSSLPPWLGYSRHIHFDHYRPVAESGAVMVARSEADMRQMLRRGLTQPDADSDRRHAFIDGIFGDTLDGCSGQRVAHCLMELAGRHRIGC